MSAPKPEKLFDDIAEFITASRKLLEQGALVELAGLDSQVRLLCDAVETLSQEERAQHAVRMRQLFADLEELETAMRRMRDAIADDMRNLSGHQKANVAYRTANAHLKPKNDDN